MDRIANLENQLLNLIKAHNALFKEVKELKASVRSLGGDDESTEDENRVVLNDGEQYLSDEEYKKLRS